MRVEDTGNYKALDAHSRSLLRGQTEGRNGARVAAAVAFLAFVAAFIGAR